MDEFIFDMRGLIYSLMITIIIHRKDTKSCSKTLEGVYYKGRIVLKYLCFYISSNCVMAFFKKRIFITFFKSFILCSELKIVCICSVSG